VLISNELMRIVSECPADDQPGLIQERQIANAQSRLGESLLMRVVRHAFRDIQSTVGPSPGFVRSLIDAGADPLVCCDSGKNVAHDLIWSAVPSEIGEESVVTSATREIFASLLQAAGKDGMLALLLCQDRLGTTPCEYWNCEMGHNWQELIESVVTYRAPKRPRCAPLTLDQSFPKAARTAATEHRAKKRALSFGQINGGVDLSCVTDGASKLCDGNHDGSNAQAFQAVGEHGDERQSSSIPLGTPRRPSMCSSEMGVSGLVYWNGMKNSTLQESDHNFSGEIASESEHEIDDHLQCIIYM